MPTLSACALRRGGGIADLVHGSISDWGIECRVSKLRMATGQQARRKRRGEEVVPTIYSRPSVEVIIPYQVRRSEWGEEHGGGGLMAPRGI